MRLPMLLLVALLAAAPLPAEPPAGSPPGIAPAVAMTDRPVAMVALDASRRPVEVLQFLGLKRGDRVLDVMAGTGYYSEIIGNAIGRKGRVVALELPIVMTDPDQHAAIEGVVARVPNVSILPVQPGEVRVTPNSYDFVLMHLVYHDTYFESTKYGHDRMDPDAFLRKLYISVKPGGIVGVVDHVANPGGDTRAVVDQLHRIDPATIKADFARAGFKLEAESDLLRVPGDNHNTLVFDPAIRGKTDRVVLRFRKPGPAA